MAVHLVGGVLLSQREDLNFFTTVCQCPHLSGVFSSLSCGSHTSPGRFTCEPLVDPGVLLWTYFPECLPLTPGFPCKRVIVLLKVTLHLSRSPVQA